jgi:hypothetical protein
MKSAPALTLLSNSSVTEPREQAAVSAAFVPFKVTVQGPAFHPRKRYPGYSFFDTAILPLLLFAFMKAFQDRRAPWYLRGLIRKPLRKIGVILLHDVEHCFLGQIAMVLRN